MKNTQQIKIKIINLFVKNVKGSYPDVSKANKGHDGKSGHWLETRMGIKHNSKNEADLYGFEMKNNTTSKTTFGDWSADYYIFKDLKYFSKDRAEVNRDKFMRIFGGQSSEYEGRYSWSGRSAPKIKGYNDFGQKLVVDKKNNILAIYSYSKDIRKDKSKSVPHIMQRDNLTLARWHVESMTIKLERKFNNLGWFKCICDKKTGIYTNIIFGGPIDFKSWIAGVKKGLIYFDSGMHIGNKRPYSNWRADNKYWDLLVTDKY